MPPWQPALVSAIDDLALLLDGAAALVVVFGLAGAALATLRGLWTGGHESRHAVRLAFVENLVFALDFTVAADILSTAVAPSLDAVVRLGGIVTIRVVLNFVLAWELRTARGEAAPLGEARADAGARRAG